MGALASCADLIKLVFLDISKTTNYDKINGLWNFCDGKKIVDSESLGTFYYSMKQAFTNMTMMNYPYKTNFMTNLQAWPVRAACDSFKDANEPDVVYYAEFKAASEVYFGKDKCVNLDLTPPKAVEALLCN